MAIHGKQEVRINQKHAQNVNHTLGIKMEKRIKIKFDLVINGNIFNARYFKDGLHYKSGIYGYFYNDICLYVGATNNLFIRALRCYKNKTPGDKLHQVVNILNPYSTEIKIRFIKVSLLNKYEKYYCMKLKPLLNNKSLMPYRVSRKVDI